jgi:hypothetical protein
MIEIIEITSPYDGSVVEYVKIIHNENEYTTMLKSTYDEQQAEQSTPSVTNGD